MDTITAPSRYNLNAVRHLPRIIEIDTAILPSFWAEFAAKNKIEIHCVIGYENGASNMKIWPASNIIARLVESGEPLLSDTVIDSSSGNFAKAVAIVLRQLCAIDSHFPIRRVVSVVTRDLPRDKRRSLEELGIELRDADNSIDAMRLAKEIAEKEKFIYLRQYWNPDNPASYLRIAHSIADSLPELGAIALGVGSGGSCAGIMPVLRERFEKRPQPLRRVAVIVENGESVDGVRSEPALEPGSLPWREAVDEARFVGEQPALAMSTALWRQAHDSCIGGPSTGFALEGLLLALRSLGIVRQLDAYRDENGFVQAAFLAPDTRKPYRSKYEQHGLHYPIENW